MLQGLRFLFTPFLLFATGTLLGQSYSSTQYLVEDGLPSNEVFSVVQGQQGYIWASTDKGIVRYDGSTFKTYGIYDGLRSVVSYRILASPLGGIVFYDTDNRVGLIKNDSIRYFSNDSSSFIATISSSKYGPVICHGDSSCYEVYSWKGKKRSRQCYPPGFYVIDDHKIGLIAIGKNQSDTSNGTYIGSNGKQVSGNMLFTDLSQTRCLQQHGDQNILVRRSLLCYVQGHAPLIKKTLQGNSSIGSFIDSEGRLWIGFFDRGVEAISLTDEGSSFRLLDGYSVSSICEDDEGNMWFGTLRDGIIKLTKSYFQPIVKGQIEKMALFNGQLVAASTRPSLHLFNLKSGLHGEIKTDFKISDMLQVEDHLIVSTDRESKQIPPEKNIVYMGIFFSKLLNYRNQPASVTRDLLGTRNIGKETKHYTLDSIGLGYTYVVKNFEDTIYVGRSAGLFRIYEIEGQFRVNKVLSVAATALLKTDRGYVIGTKGKGLIFTDLNFSVKKRYSTKNGLCGNFVSSIELAEDMLICGTANGLSFVTKIYTPSQTKISSSHTSNGLWSSNVTDLKIHGQTLFVATDKGVQKITLGNTYRYAPNPRPIINHINKRQIASENPLKVVAGAKVIKIGLATIFFHDNKNYLREYRLLGNDSIWVASTSSELEFLNLNPGKYELQFRTKLHENAQYSSTSLQFELLPLFTQTIWFKVGIGLFILLVLLLLRYLRERQIRERNGMVLLQEQLRYKALASQLNPHFMFNALGSVQNLIITKKNDKAAEYLASFSGLMSKTLRNTNELFIPLRDEMVFINEYVEIEKFRFEKSITFNWHVSKEIQARETLVPTMFLQPYVENAIIHGINPSAEAGQIDIAIRVLRTDVLEIQIRDNGIGIEIAKANRSKRARKSMAMENIQTRIQTMAKLYENTFRHQATQMVNDNGIICGTEVILDIPFKSR